MSMCRCSFAAFGWVSAFRAGSPASFGALGGVGWSVLEPVVEEAAESSICVAIFLLYGVTC